MSEAFAVRAQQQDAFFRDLIADPDTDVGVNPCWAHLYPYQAIGSPGASFQIELRIQNLRRKPIDVQAMLVLPKGWRAAPVKRRVRALPGETASSPVTVTIPANWRSDHSRIAIAADIVLDGRYLGQIAEAVVDITSNPDARPRA